MGCIFSKDSVGTDKKKDKVDGIMSHMVRYMLYMVLLSFRCLVQASSHIYLTFQFSFQTAEQNDVAHGQR